MTKRLSGRAAVERNRRILAANDVCHICGKPGADAIDHVVPLARGGTEDPSNLRPAHHNVEPKCNARKGARLPSEIDRRVVLICGPSGAGKTTLAHSLGLEVYDLDDLRWNNNDALFRASLTMLREDPKAQAAVIRTGATLSARQKAASNCGATEVIVLETALAECVARIKQRDRTDPPISQQIGWAHAWWRNYQPGDVKTSFASLRLRTSQDW